MSDQTAERPAPVNVIQALARVMEELPGIGRNERSQQGYNYRGIEAITREASSLLGRYGVVFVPKVIERKTIDLMVNGKPWTEDHATILYTVYGPGGIEDRIEVGPLIALGRDNSDKGMNKCMTQAFKYALLQTLCIGDSKDDADAHAAAEADAPAPVTGPKTEGWDSAEQEAEAHKEIRARLAQLPEDHPVRLAGRVMREKHGWPVPLARLAELRDLLDEAERPSAPAGNDEKAPSAPQTVDSPAEAPAPAPAEKPKRTRQAGPAVKCAWCGNDIADEAALPVTFEGQSRFMHAGCKVEWAEDAESASRPADPF